MPDPDLRDESDLIAAAARGDRDAFGALVRAHQGPLFRFARALTDGEARAEDVLQEALLAAWRGLAAYRGEASLRSWLFTIVRRTAWRARSRGAREEATEGERLDALGAAAGWGDEGAVSALDDRVATRALLVRAFGSLTADERAIVTLRDLEGLSGDQAAAVLGLSLPAVKSRLHRARLRLAAEVRRLDREELDDGS